nr:AraC family transcriptional regulator [Bacilli bacterium]
MEGYVFATFTEKDESLPFRITIAGVAQNQHPIVRIGGWENFQWLQCSEGIGEFTIEGQKYIIQPGQGILLFPETSHEYHPIQTPWMMNWLSFDGPLVRPTLHAFNMETTKVLQVNQPDQTLAKIIDIYQTLMANQENVNLTCSALLYRLMIDLFASTSDTKSHTSQQKYAQLSPVLSYIEDNYRHPISLSELSTLLHVSQQYLCTLFRVTLGIRPFEYINRIKIQHAKEMILHDEHLSIRAIAQEVGYDNYGYFLRTFKALEGVTPSEFRHRYRSSIPSVIPYDI